MMHLDGDSRSQGNPHAGNPRRPDRRQLMSQLAAAAVGGGLWSLGHQAPAALAPQTAGAVDRGLKWVAETQSRLGHWTAMNYATAMTALAGTALLASGSTTTQGPYARNIRRAVDYLIGMARPNGLIGEQRDSRYTYGHGFSMLFLSQVLGEEEDAARRADLLQLLGKAVEFSGRAQTKSGGWGYVSAADGNDFDEGSTTITQVQGLRGCRNAGIPVSLDVIERAKKYIYGCKNADGGISYSSRNRGASRPAITAAALAALYNAGDYDSEHVPEMLSYCKKNLYRSGGRHFGHWHYTYLYYSQVVYRQGEDEWRSFRDWLYGQILADQLDNGSWRGESIGPIYITSINLTILQLENAFLPIYQR